MTTITYVKIPADVTQAPVVCEVTDPVGPYELVENEFKTHAEKVYTQQLHEFHQGLHMFVDEMGAYKQDQLGVNSRAMRFYPYAPIYGEVILVQLKNVMTDEGPDLELDSIDPLVIQKIQGLWRHN